MKHIDVSWLHLSYLYLLLLVPVVLLYYLHIPLASRMFKAVARMTVQLMLVGVYFKYLFHLNNPVVNLAWAFIMIVSATYSVLQNAQLNLRYLLFPTLFSIFISSSLVMCTLMLFVVQPTPIYDARYLIPLLGMLLGNSLYGNVIALERFYNQAEELSQNSLYYLSLGANLNEAVFPWMQQSIKAALGPFILGMTTLGIVSLPGVMTGQILAGADPLVVVKYQICIFLGVFINLTLSTLLTLWLGLKYSFNEFGLLRQGIHVIDKSHKKKPFHT
ncbi:MAG TPA: ABC transporter permease [Methyloprofundus sp.]|nr:ABC transporter permease [Methyloprofundus sp.]HIL79449.1 ABC transporter permease [Methylococcales bacterium]